MFKAILFLASVIALPALAFTPKISTETMYIGKSECGDSCAITIIRGKAPDVYYVCAEQDMFGPKALQVCKDLFVGPNKTLPNVYQRKVTVKLASMPDSDVHFRIIGGHLHPDPNQAPPASQTQASKAQNGGWDNWLELTGNKAKVAKKIPDEAVHTVGVAPANVRTVLNACQHLVNRTGPGQEGIGAIHTLLYLTPVDGATVYGSHGPQVKLTPVRIGARYRDGANLSINAYIQKDTFDTLHCIRGR